MSGSNAPLDYSAIGSAALAVLLLNFISFFNLLSWYGYESFTGDGPSMMPNVQPGEGLFTLPWWYEVRDPKRGDLVTFPGKSWDGEEKWFIKRIVGLPGERLSVTNERVLINGTALDEPYVKFRGADTSSKSWNVPKGHYFVMGDNRGNSWDSRDLGPIPDEKLLRTAQTSFDDQFGFTAYMFRWIAIIGWVAGCGFLAWSSAVARGRTGQWAWAGVLFQGFGVAAVMMLTDTSGAEEDSERPRLAA